MTITIDSIYYNTDIHIKHKRPEETQTKIAERDAKEEGGVENVEGIIEKAKFTNNKEEVILDTRVSQNQHRQ